jgi:hypothetical protein
MRFIRRWREYSGLASPARRECKAGLGRVDAGSRAQRLAQPANLDAQPCAMRFIGLLSAERPRQQRRPWHIAGPSFSKHAGESEQYRACFQRNRLAGMADNMAAGIDDEGPSTSSSRKSRSLPRAINRAAGLSRTRAAASTSAKSEGIRAWRAMRSACASATIAFFMPRRLAICIAQALSQDHFVERISRIWAAS